MAIASTLELLYEGRMPRARIESYISSAKGSLQDVTMREWLSFTQSRAPQRDLRNGQAGKLVRVKLPTKDDRSVILEDGFQGLEPDEMVAFCRKSAEMQKVRLLGAASAPYLLSYFLLMLPSITIRSWKNGVVYIYGYRYNKEIDRAQLWLISSQDSSSHCGLRFTIPCPTPATVQYWQSALVKQMKFWLPGAFPRVDNLTHSCSLLSTSSATDRLPNTIAKMFGADSRVYLTDQSIESTLSSGLVSYSYSYTPTSHKEEFPYLWVGQHMKAVVEARANLVKPRLDGIVDMNEQLSRHLNRIFQKLMLKMAEELHKLTADMSLSDATLFCMKTLREMFYLRKYVYRFLDVLPIRWGNTRLIIQMSYIEKLRSVLVDRECKDIEFEFYGYDSKGDYLECVPVQYILMDGAYYYDEDTLVNLFPKPACIVVINYYQPAASARRRPIDKHYCVTLAQLGCVFARDIGLRKRERYSLLPSRVTVKRVQRGPVDSPYKNLMVRHLVEENLNSHARTNYIVCPQEDVASNRYHIGLQHFDPLFTIQELIHFSKACGEPIYVANLEERKALVHYKLLSTFLQEKLREELSKPIFYKFYVSVNLIGYLIESRVFRTSDLVTILDRPDLMSKLSALTSEIEDPMLKAFMGTFHLGLKEYYVYREKPNSIRATNFRWALLDSSLDSVARDLVEYVEEHYSLVPRMIAAADGQLIEYLTEYLNDKVKV